MKHLFFCAAFFAGCPALAADRPDALVADFEGDSYPAGWVAAGTAFGTGPAQGTLPGQMPVSGFLGKGFVNSFRGGDDSTGTLTSPEFKLERKFLNFLIGGGQHPGKTCINLVVNGKTVRTATGPNDRPGGSERLDWHTWDVAEFAGRAARLQIVDEQKGGWGHINVDHIVQSDRKKQAAVVRRTFTVNQKYLHLPVRTGAPLRRMKLLLGKEIVREFDIELAADGKPQFWAFAELEAFQAKTLSVECTLSADANLDALKLAADVPDAKNLYREKLRPVFHFTSRFGWLNDPNGLVYDGKEYHLFYQHNPFGVNWGNMHWGHAVSPDLVRWKELGIGLYPKKYGDWAFSGSAAADYTGAIPAAKAFDIPPRLALAYTSTGRGECIAFSTDSGRTWTESEQNPAVKHTGRDPKLVWYEKGKHWVMAVYDEFQGKRWIAFYTSPDLKKWTFASRIEGFYECPDLFELPVSLPQAQFGSSSRWVLYAADGKYLLGDFDGKTFTPDSQEKQTLWHGRFYAAQTFDNAPWIAPQGSSMDVRRKPRYQIGWASGVTFPGMPFNQQMTVPVELRLEAGDGKRGPRLTAWPIAALNALHGEKVFSVFEKKQMVEQPLVLADGLDAFDVDITVAPGRAKGFALDLRGTKLVFDAAKKTLTCKDVAAPVEVPHPAVGGLKLRVLVDRGSIEVFTGDGRTAMSIAAVPEEKNRRIRLVPNGGAITIERAAVFRMERPAP